VNGCMSSSLFPKGDILTKGEIQSWKCFPDRVFASSLRENFSTISNREVRISIISRSLRRETNLT
jgi:hypothetical protein